MGALYDAEGNRVYRNLDGVETFYFGADYQVSDGVSEVSYSLGGQTVGHLIGGVFTAASLDHLGSGAVTLTADADPIVQRYTPFGVIRDGGTNVLPVDETFTGQTDDPGTGLIDYNARHYDPQLGRFIMADPVLDGLNRYGYVHNNPLAFTDPDGTESCYVPGASMGCEEKAALSSDGPSWVERQLDNFKRGLDNICFQLSNGSDNNCDSIAELEPERTQTFVNGAAGVADAITLGNLDTSLTVVDAVTPYSDSRNKYDESSGAFLNGSLGGLALLAPFAVGSPLTAARYATVAGSVNTIDTCSQARDRGCAFVLGTTVLSGGGQMFSRWAAARFGAALTNRGSAWPSLTGPLLQELGTTVQTAAPVAGATGANLVTAGTAAYEWARGRFW